MSTNTTSDFHRVIKPDGIYILTKEDVTYLKLIMNNLDANDNPIASLLLDTLNNAYCGQV